MVWLERNGILAVPGRQGDTMWLRKGLALFCLALAAGSLRAEDKPRFNVLVFSKTAAFRHGAIPDALKTIRELGQTHRFAVEDTEDAGQFTSQYLKKFRVVVFNNTTGDVLNSEQQAAFEKFIRKGGNFVGIHAATDCEYDWPWYAGLVGAQFKTHPAGQTATVVVEDRTHPSTRMLPEKWTIFDEWYDFRVSPRPNVTVLANLDESSYRNGTMGADHPIIWCQQYDGGRSWYTGLGHANKNYSDPLFRAHLLGGLLWAAGVEKAPKPVKKTKPVSVPKG